MNAKTIIGLILIVISILLLIFVVESVKNNIPSTGQWAGKITMYRQPYLNHGIMLIWAGIAALLLFLAGIILFFLGRKF